ncbi:MAG: AAA family ATPase, partial [Chloroflexota bacterium]|nr:AAA family ATPase [Chloroflexota bacterium]
MTTLPVPRTIEERQDALTALYDEYFPPGDRTVARSPGPAPERRPSAGSLADDRVLARARAARNGAKFALLWEGRWREAGYSSQSEADLALACMLAFWTGGNREQMDRLFRRSDLYREKWDERHYGDGRTYGEGTIAKALDLTEDSYQLGGPDLTPGGRQATGDHSGGGNGTTTDDRVQRRFRLRPVAEIKCQPPPAWLVDGVLVRDTLAAIVGPPASCKSFVALDVALSVATGHPWLDHGVHQSTVVYISAEGSAGLGRRIAAWERARRVDAEKAPCYVLPEAVQFLQAGDVDAILAAVGELPAEPGLVVVDTLARCFVGGEENSARDMGFLVAAVERLRQTTGACVVLIHHVNKTTGKMRGSTALEGAMDTIVAARRDGTLVTLACDKQKDADEFAAFHLTKRVIDLDGGESSMVLEIATTPGTPLTDSARTALRALHETFGTRGGTAKEWERVADERNVPRSTFYRVKRDLVQGGAVQSTGDRPPRFVLTARGLS